MGLWLSFYYFSHGIFAPHFALAYKSRSTKTHGGLQFRFVGLLVEMLVKKPVTTTRNHSCSPAKSRRLTDLDFVLFFFKFISVFPHHCCLSFRWTHAKNSQLP